MFQPISTAVHNGKYHGCFMVYENGTRPMIEKGDNCHHATEKGDNCYLATNDPFWKHSKDVDFKIQTRAQKGKSKIAKRENINSYLTQ